MGGGLNQYSTPLIIWTPLAKQIFPHARSEMFTQNTTTGSSHYCIHSVTLLTLLYPQSVSHSSHYCIHSVTLLTPLYPQCHTPHTTVSTVSHSSLYCIHSVTLLTPLYPQCYTPHSTVSTVSHSSLYCIHSVTLLTLLYPQCHTPHSTVSTVSHSSLYCIQCYTHHKTGNEVSWSIGLSILLVPLPSGHLATPSIPKRVTILT